MIQIKVLDRIQDFEEYSKLAKFIADIESVDKELTISDEKLSRSFAYLDHQIGTSNLVLLFDNALGAVKQKFFPFAYHFVNTLEISDDFDFLTNNIESMVEQALRDLDKLKQETALFQSQISNLHDLMGYQKFDHSNANGKPF